MATMLEFVIDELQKRKNSLPALCKELGWPSYSWLSKLSLGKIPDPSCRKIELLAAYFGAENARTGERIRANRKTGMTKRTIERVLRK